MSGTRNDREQFRRYERCLIRWLARLAGLKSERKSDTHEPVEAARNQFLTIVCDRRLLVKQISQVNDSGPLPGYKAYAGQFLRHRNA